MKHRRPCPDLRSRLLDVIDYACRNSIVTENGCWEWTGTKNRLGYGQACFGNRQWTATRLIYCATQGAFDPTLDVCHECDNPGCCNPAHLWLGTMKDNIRDAQKKGRHFLSALTQCSRGHDYTPENTAIHIDKHGHRHRRCIICERNRGKKWDSRRAETQRRWRAKRLGINNPAVHWFSKQILPERFGHACRILQRVAPRRFLVEFHDGKRIEASYYATRRPKGRAAVNGTGDP